MLGLKCFVGVTGHLRGKIKSCGSPELQISREEEAESLKHGDHLGEGNTNVFFFGSLGLALPCPGGAGGAGRWSPACPVSAATQKLEKCLEKRFFLI